MLVPTTLLGELTDNSIEIVAGHTQIAAVVLALATILVSALGYYFLKGVLTHLVLSRRSGSDPPGLVALARTLPYAPMIATDLMLAFGVGVGLELLIVPGVIFGTRYGLAPILVEVEDLGAFGAMRRSRELVRGHFWIVATILFVTLGGVALLSLPLKALAAVVLPGGADDPLEEALGLLLAGILVKPIGAVTSVELTLDLMKAEG